MINMLKECNGLQISVESSINLQSTAFFLKNYHAFTISLFQTNIRILSKQQATAKNIRI